MKQRNRKPSEKQKKGAQVIVQQMMRGEKPNYTEAARQAYDTNQPDVMGHKLNKSRAVRTYIDEIMDRAGMTEPRLVWKLKTIMDEADDQRLQFDALKEGLKIKQVYPATTNRNVNVNFEGKDVLEKLYGDLDEDKIS